MTVAGCSRFAANHSNDPQSCRERAAYRMASAYPSPQDLGVALAIVCDGLVPAVSTLPPPPLTTTIPPGETTTTRPP
jgi:hypothetical protein